MPKNHSQKGLTFLGEYAPLHYDRLLQVASHRAISEKLNPSHATENTCSSYIIVILNMMMMCSVILILSEGMSTLAWTHQDWWDLMTFPSPLWVIGWASTTANLIKPLGRHTASAYKPMTGLSFAIAAWLCSSLGYQHFCPCMTLVTNFCRTYGARSVFLTW